MIVKKEYINFIIISIEAGSCLWSFKIQLK